MTCLLVIGLSLKMPRKPAKSYYQNRGRRHRGLSDPESFGLTYAEVVELIEQDKWRSFSIQFAAKKRREKKLVEHNFRCPICKFEKKDLIEWNSKVTCCKDCAKTKIKEQSNEKEDEQGPNTNRARNRKKDPITRGICHFCKKQRTIAKYIIGYSACLLCANKLQELQDEIQRSRDSI